MAKRKGDRSQVRQRVQQCVSWIIEGYSYMDIVRTIATYKDLTEDQLNSMSEAQQKKVRLLQWDVKERMVRYYCEKADAEIAKMLEPVRENEFRKAYSRYQLILKKALQKGDLNAARRAQQQIDKITGVSEFGGKGKGTAVERSVIVLPDGREIPL